MATSDFLEKCTDESVKNARKVYSTKYIATIFGIFSVVVVVVI